MSRGFDRVYACEGRPSIPPERLVRASTRQILYSIRSERLLCEQLDYDLLFRGFVGLSTMNVTEQRRVPRRNERGLI